MKKTYTFLVFIIAVGFCFLSSDNIARAFQGEGFLQAENSNSLFPSIGNVVKNATSQFSTDDNASQNDTSQNQEPQVNNSNQVRNNQLPITTQTNTFNNQNQTPPTSQMQLGRSYAVIVDNANVLSPEQEQHLLEKIEKLKTDYNFEYTLVTIAHNVQQSLALAKNFKNINTHRNGLVFVNNIRLRDFGTNPRGAAFEMFNGKANEALQDHIIPHLKNADYFGAYNAHIDFTAELLALDAQGVEFDYWSDEELLFVALAILGSLIAAACTSSFSMKKLRNSMNTTGEKTEACDYVLQGSFNLKYENNHFVHRETTSVYSPQKSNHSGSSSGGGGGGGASGGSY